MEPTIHQAERRDQRGRRFFSLVAVAAVGLIGATWMGLVSFLGANSAFGTVEEVSDHYLPDVRSLNLDLPDLGQLSEVYTADGVLLGTLTERNSQPVPIEEIPELVIQAILAAEDAQYYQHEGIDFKAILRAAIEDASGGPRQGGSTLTQQVVKQNFIGSEQTLERKAREAVIAAELERRYSKDDILEFYLNSVFFGWNAYGVKAAAAEYFGKDLETLSVSQAAALATPIRNPSLYDMRRNPAIVERTRNAIIDNMAEEGFITPAAAENAKRDPVVPVPHQEFERLAPEVVITVTEELLNNPRYGLGETFTARKRTVFGCPASDTTCEGGGGLKVTVSLDFGLQQSAEALLKQWFPISGGEVPTGAIALVDNRTGAIKVMAGALEFGEDEEAGQRPYDLAGKGRQNPGSAFKPIGLMAALEQGFSLGSYWDWTSPQILPDWKPTGECNNFSRSGEGIRTLESATVNSTNTVFCQLSLATGADNIVDMAHRLGIESPVNPVPSIVLGTQAVSPLEMASAYSTIANHGARVDSYLIAQIENSRGEVIYRHKVERRQVVDSALAAAVVNTLKKVVTSGTGQRANIGRPQAGKTGTHQNITDVWFVGFIPQYTAAVWVGHADRQIPLRNVTINGELFRSASSSRVPAPLWQKFMLIVTEGLPELDFPPDPDGISSYYVTPKTEVPDLTELIDEEGVLESREDFEDLKSLIYHAGLDLVIEFENSIEVENFLLEMDPEPGKTIRQGQTVTILLSSGLPPEFEMPNLLRLTFEEAGEVLRQKAEEVGITITWVREDQITNNPNRVGQVVGTDPPRNGIVMDGATVTLFMGIEPPPDEGDGEPPPEP